MDAASVASERGEEKDAEYIFMVFGKEQSLSPSPFQSNLTFLHAILTETNEL